ncbi:DUF3016 domain-containing protein [Luteimonas huabeiensis]|uniref:DUF3016 domain-containing protein n=1 Tax=Luteimonas huabeiensis TaxID=1244513 RepID=UPI0004665BAA|nr:DUF3016 domain-containing protein [Luteimonas huabeiensis]
MVRAFAAALLAAVLTACAGGPVRDVTDPELPRALPEAGPVAVSWTDPARFSDLARSGNRWEARRGDWVRELAEHLRDAVAARLPAGERVEITITDIRRAGDYEPWLGPNLQDVRMMRDIYWPQITLQLRRTDASGRTIDEGERILRDPSYLTTGASSGRSGESLYYEKRMIDDWARREFPAPAR